MIVLIMGVSGSGKTTIGELLARRLGWGFSDADDFHGAANHAKMAAGIALTDEDRWPWLARVRAAIDEQRRLGNNHVFVCSALKRVYRQRLSSDSTDLRLVYLAGSAELLAERLSHRRGHFFAPQLLADQLATLEPPTADEALSVDIRPAPQAIVDEILKQLNLSEKA